VGGFNLALEQIGYSLQSAVASFAMDDHAVQDALEPLHVKLAEAANAIDDFFAAMNDYVRRGRP
jgi:hypothetical protein